MAKRWRIRGYEGLDDMFDGWASGRLSDRQVKQLLVHLHCRHLSENEIITAVNESRDRDRVDFMVVPLMGNRAGYMTTGNPHYTATYEDPDA